jgi:hypothetical protein
MALLLCAFNVFLVFVEVKVKVYHRKHEYWNNVKLGVSDEKYFLIALLTQERGDDHLLLA